MAIKSYSDFINSSASEKVVIAHIHGVRRVSNFTSDSGLYSQVVDHVVTEVKNGEIPFTRVSDLGLVVADTFYYDFDTGKLYLHSFTSNTDEIIVTFRFFLSNIPINLPWDLQDSSKEVSYDPIIKSIPKFKSNLTQGKKGINLIGSGVISCDNTAGYFDDIYSALIFDNKKAEVYSYNRSLMPSQAQIIFRGRVTGSVFNPTKVDFNLTDDIYSLEPKVSGNQYLDEVVEADRLNFKRRIFGRVDNLKVQSLEQAGKGITLTGSLSGNRKSKTIRGVGSKFIEELSEGDSIHIANLKLTVDKIINDNSLTITSDLDISFNSNNGIYFPRDAYYKSNRRFQVANHALKVYSTTITAIKARNRLRVADPNGFKANDVISIGGNENKEIKRVSGNEIVLKSSYNRNHSIGDLVETLPITKLGYDNRQVGLSDFTVENTSSGTYLNLSNKAEINSADEKTLNYSFYFRNGHSKIWLGTPTIFKINTVAHINQSLYGKYFTIYNESDKGVAFWFSDSLPLDITEVVEPSHGMSDSVRIELEHKDYTSSEIAELCLSYITENLDFYTGFSDSNSYTLETTLPKPTLLAGVNTSGFSVTSLAVGVSSDSDLSLDTLLYPRDYVFSSGEAAEYEVLRADTKAIFLRKNYEGPTGYFNLTYKNVQYIQDNTPVYVNCVGATKDGQPNGDFISTISEVVSYLLDDAGLEQFKHTPSFLGSSSKAPQLVSLALPYNFNGDMPSIKDVVNKLNTSVMGSLYITKNLELGYDILDASLDLNSLRSIRDDDVLNWNISGDGFDLSKSLVGNYCFVDYEPNSKNQSNQQVNYSSEFVEKYVGNKNTREINLYLYDKSEAQEQIERDELINSLSNSTIKIKGSINLSKFQLGERVVLDFKRLYKVGESRLHVALITSMDNNGEDVNLELEDLGALYSRAATVADDGSIDDYASSLPSDRLTTSFIIDDNGLISDLEDSNNTSLIS